MLEKQLWHPVALVSDLPEGSGAGPLAVRLLEQDIVLWRDVSGVARAFVDQCPHRGARLSRGQVFDGQLECPYHGWQFDGQGQVIRIPAVPNFTPPQSMRACALQCKEQYGLLWVRLSDGGQAPAIQTVPNFPAESNPILRKTNCGPYWVDTSAPRIVENFLDMAHFGFVHEHYLGDREHVNLPDYVVQESADPMGFKAVQCQAWQPKSSVHATGGAWVQYTYEVNAPYTAVLTKIPEEGRAAIAQFEESIALFVCPVEPEKSLVWFRLAMNDFASPDSALQAFQDTIFSQDKPVVESQRPKRLPLDPKAELHSAADKASAAYRRYLKRLGIQFGVC